jgi:CHAT domain-containing protein/Tfp pilus assembly protein PilF
VNRGDLQGAAADAENALRKSSSPHSEWYWQFTSLKAEILVRMRLSAQALELLKPDLPAFLAKTDIAVWRKLTQGTAHCYLSEFDSSSQFLDQAEALARAEHPEMLGEVALRMGTLAYWRGDFAVAESQYQTALRISREQKQPFLEAAALGSLGLVAIKREHYDESIEWNQAALRLSRTIGAQSSAARILGNLGWSYFVMGDYENALDLAQQAEASFENAGSVGNQINWLINIAKAEYYLREYPAVEEKSLKALVLARKLNEKVAIAQSLNNLSNVALVKRQFDAAEKYNLEALEVSHFAKDHSDEVSSKLIAARIESARGEYQKARHFFAEVLQDSTAEASSRWQAEARLAKIYGDEGQWANAEKEYRKAIGTIEGARASVSRDEFRLTFLSSAIEFYDDYVDFLVAHGRPDDALMVAELSRARTLAEGLASTTEAASLATKGLRPQQIARKLNASLLFYWVGQNQSHLWVIAPEKTAYFKLPKAADIEPLVKAYREALPNVDNAQDTAASDGKKLYAMLVEPAKKLIPPGSRVILLPAESLYGLNFETLIVPEPKPHFWIEDITLTTANSLTLLNTSIQRPAIAGKNLLLVGNAVPTPGFPALPQAPMEIQKVSHYFSDQNRKVLEAKQATATAYLSSNPERYAYLHFVTHGTASFTRPLESAVILSPEGDSYKLYARDIVNHHLNAQLVTISACNGSGKRTLFGEGVVGLSWAFLRAGAHNVIGALWEVSDASTPQLMDAFYRELFQGKDAATALRDAKLGLLHTPDPDSVFKNPFYWAPFQLYAGS